MPEIIPALVFLTDDKTSIDPKFLQPGGKAKHLAFSDTGLEISVTVTVYKGKKAVSETITHFSGSMIAGFSAFIYSEFRHAARSGVLVYAHTPDLYLLLKETILKSELPYIIWLTDTDNTAFNWKQQNFVSAAIARICFSKDIKKLLQSTLVYDCDVLDKKSLMPVLRACSRRFASPYKAKTRRNSEHKCLLVSYFAPPSETVAVHRIAYWEENLPKLAKASKETMTVDVLTANNSYKTRADMIYVADKGEIDCSEPQTHKFVKYMESIRVNHFSAYWASHIRQWLLDNPHVKYDSVVLSGNPFYYFELAEVFKKIWAAKVVLDFRDPFANNPRFKFTEPHKILVCKLEDSYLSNADYALSVNQYCLESLRLKDKSKGVVVANGYDERIVEKAKPLPLRIKDDKVSFVYTGSFYADRNPEPFLKGLNPDTQKLIHIGRVAKTDEHLDRYPAMERYGLVPYQDVIKYCKSVDAGIIFTSGAAFEQTTKIFDYIAADIDIIIVTEGVVKTGELHRITKDMSNVYWLKNKAGSIDSFLKTFQPSKNKRDNRSAFSRIEQTKKLYSILTGNPTGIH